MPNPDLSLLTRPSTPSTSHMVRHFMRCCVFHTHVIPAIGPGGNTSQRVSDHILDGRAASDFTLEKVFLGTPHWIDFEYQS